MYVRFMSINAVMRYNFSSSSTLERYTTCTLKIHTQGSLALLLLTISLSNSLLTHTAN